MPSNSLAPDDSPAFVLLPQPGTRWGDSTKERQPAWNFSTDRRPMVGTSRVYQGKEVEANNDNKIAGLSPGPMYAPAPGKRVAIPSYSRNPPAYHFGGVFPVIDKRFSPAPGNYGFAQARSLGPQKIDSSMPSKPMWGMGSSTREHTARLHLHTTSNNTSHCLVFNGGVTDAPPKLGASKSVGELAADATAPSSEGATDRKNLTRALAVAMAAKQAEADPELAAALSALHSRVGVLRAQKEVS